MDWCYTCCKKWEDEFARVMMNKPLDLTNERIYIKGEFVDYIKTYDVIGGETVIREKNGMLYMEARKGKKCSYAFRTINKDDDKTQEVIELYEEANRVKVKDIKETVEVFNNSNSVAFGGLQVIKEVYPNISCCCDVCQKREKCQPIDIRVCRSLQEWRNLCG